jgi:hypothetical protein
MPGSRAALGGTLESVLHGPTRPSAVAVSDDESRRVVLERLRGEADDPDSLGEATRLAVAWIWLRHVRRFLERHDLASVDAAVDAI